LLFVVLGIVGGSLHADASPLRHKSPPAASTQRPLAADMHLSVVVHRGGGRVVAGAYDDAKRWVSHAVQTTGRSEATIPAFEGSEAEWRGLMSCVRSQYSGLPVDFVEEPPATGDYVLVVVGGSPRDMGLAHTWGWASAGSGDVVSEGVGFVFSAAHRAKDRTLALCETLTHEVGHLIGLNHSTDCDDVMNTGEGCTNRDYQGGTLRGFRQANRSVLASSLAAWTKHSSDPELRYASDEHHQPPKTRARPATKLDHRATAHRRSVRP